MAKSHCQKILNSSFDTKLPQRWDLAGWDHSGLYMNGLWHPQFTENREALWTVQINVPDSYWVVFNGQISKGETTWTGQAHVHDLTILPNIEVYDTGQHIIVSAHSAVNQAERLEFCCQSPIQRPRSWLLQCIIDWQLRAKIKSGLVHMLWKEI